MRFAEWQKSGRRGAVLEPSFLSASRDVPLVYACRDPHADLCDWYGEHRQEVESRLLEHGAILFRGFNLRTEADFAAATRAMIPICSPYIEGATPRTALGDNIYTSTEFPHEQEIFLHNELSYTRQPPERLLFFCMIEPGAGGQTPLADTRRVCRRIPADVVAEFEARGGWMLIRRFCPALGLGLRDAYKGMSLDEIHDYCRLNDVEIEQRDENDATTRQIRPLTIAHPVTDELSWFNHVVFWHPSSLSPEVRAGLSLHARREGLPFDTRYADGSVIPDETIERIRAAYRAEERLFDWRQGDLLLLDNFSVAHGRKPYSGARRVLVSMGRRARPVA